jgi:hypothetical protein
MTESTLVVGIPAFPKIRKGYQVFGVSGPLIPPRPVRVSTTLPVVGTNTPACTEGVDCSGVKAGDWTVVGATGPEPTVGETANAGALSPAIEMLSTATAVMTALMARKPAETGRKMAEQIER